METETKVLSYGEKMVGLTFNPSNDPQVQNVKEFYAKIIDALVALPVDGTGGFRSDIIDEAVRHTVTAQMWAVKAITWKD